jgi:four helix bundle protein
MDTSIKTGKTRYDLEERTSVFGEQIIQFAKEIEPNVVTRPIISQLVRAGTSIGAIYHEANECNSGKDFIYKISLAKKEAKETIYWLRLVKTVDNKLSETSDLLTKEVHELVLIFASILRRSK